MIEWFMPAPLRFPALIPGTLDQAGRGQVITVVDGLEGVGEYLDFKQRIRTHKNGILPDRVWEINSRKLSGGISLAKCLDCEGATSATPTFRVILHGKPIGFIERGHRQISDEAIVGKGVFPKMISALEKYEKTFFKKSGYAGYFSNMLAKIDALVSPEVLGFVKRLSGVNHIDFTKQGYVAGKLMKLGYSLSPQDLQFVKKHMGASSPKIEDIINYLGSDRGKRVGYYFVLYKPVNYSTPSKK